MPIATPPKIKEQELYEAWSANKSPTTLTPLIKALEPTIRSSMAVHGYNNDRNIEWKVKNHLIDQLENRYDPSKGTNVKTFTYETMKRIPRIAASQKHGIHVPESADYDLRRLRGVEQDLLDKLGREPTEAELGDALGLSPSRIQKVRERYGKAELTESMNLATGAGSASAKNDNDVEDPALKLWIQYTVDSLSPRDRKIYEWLTRARPLPKTEIAKRLGISPAAVTQRTAKIVEMLNEFND
jgi:DNA-directed RNA polymerase specialized sigma subunit